MPAQFGSLRAAAAVWTPGSVDIAGRPEGCLNCDFWDSGDYRILLRGRQDPDVYFGDGAWDHLSAAVVTEVQLFQKGGLARAYTLFGEELTQILEEFNLALAA